MPTLKTINLCFILAQVPKTKREWLQVADEYMVMWNFPNCLGSLDGKHVTMKAPNHSGSLYYNYKGFNSIVLMALVDASYKFTYIDVGCNGRISDGGVFSNCSLSSAIECNTLDIPSPQPLPTRTEPTPFVLVADDAFPLKENIMKPFAFRNQGIKERVFNYRLSRARRVVENTFGIIAARFRILRRPIELNVPKTICVVQAICALHNYLLTRNSRRLYAPPGYLDEDIGSGGIRNGEWRLEPVSATNFLPLNNAPENRPFTRNAKAVREEFEEYFISPSGELQWQYRHIYAQQS